MKTSFALVALLGLVAASSAQLLAGLVHLEDDGQWKPHLDNSALGSGAITWLGADLDDGQYKPHLDGSIHGLIHRFRRSLLVNPNALPVPADTLHVALAKQAQLIQQNTEGTRNILGGGIPIHLPADTPEVAIGKQAHAIAHEQQKSLTHGLVAPIAPIASAPIAARIASPYSVGLGYSGLGYSGLGYSGLGYSGLGYSSLGYSGLTHPYAGLRALW